MDDPIAFLLADLTPVRPSDPFFITGSGRCGTTLLRRLVIEHTGAVIPPENNTLPSSARIMQRAGDDWDLFCGLVLEHLQSQSGSWEYFGLHPDQVLARLLTLPKPYRSQANFWHAFHAIYACHVGKPSCTRWGDKTPSNTAELPAIAALFPTARFVFLVRDVFDMAYSYGSMPVAGRAGQYLGGARRWVHANTCMLDFAVKYPTQSLFVRYEDLAASPIQVTQSVLGHLRLEECGHLAMSEQEARDIVARPHLGRVRGVVTTDRVGGGRSSLPGAVRAMITELAGPLQRRFGYEPTGEPDTGHRHVQAASVRTSP